jgi:hypothetical protein
MTSLLPASTSRIAGPEKPIGFKAPMVRAILAGRKTQTRRVLRPIKGVTLADFTFSGDQVARWGSLPIEKIRKPAYAVGDRLWVREAWRAGKQWDRVTPRDIPRGEAIWFEADQPFPMQTPGKLRPSIFLPLWAARPDRLVVTAVRVERLQDISKEDAIAEGIEWRNSTLSVGGYWGTWNADNTMRCGGSPDPIEAYRCLWININGPGSWEANPWVAVYGLSRRAAG